MALVKALRGFGVPGACWNRCKPALLHPNVSNTREKALAHCKAQLHILGQRLAKQRSAVSNAKEAYDRSQVKLIVLEDEVAKLDLQYRELSVDPLTPSSSKVAHGPQLEEVQSSIDGMDLTNQCGDPDPPHPQLAVQPRGWIVSPLLAAAFVQNEDASKRCRVVAAFSHNSVLKAAEMGQLSQRDGARLISSLCSLYGMAVPAGCVPVDTSSSKYPVFWGKGKKGRKGKTKKKAFRF